MADLGDFVPFLNGEEVPGSRYEQKTIEDELEESYDDTFSVSGELSESLEEKDDGLITRENVTKYGPAILNGALLGTIASGMIAYAVDPEFQDFIHELPRYIRDLG